jgi:hypothetical protein
MLNLCILPSKRRNIATQHNIPARLCNRFTVPHDRYRKHGICNRYLVNFFMQGLQSITLDFRCSSWYLLQQSIIFTETSSVSASISGFRCVVDDFCAILGCYPALCGNCLPTFRDNTSVPSSRVKSRWRIATRYSAISYKRADFFVRFNVMSKRLSGFNFTCQTVTWE